MAKQFQLEKDVTALRSHVIELRLGDLRASHRAPFMR
jgi:hypothetical protein